MTGADPGAGKIDVHAHYFGPDYLGFLERQGVDTALGRHELAGDAALGHRLELMDRAGIGVQIVSGAPLFPSFASAAVAADAARRHNDELLRFVERGRGRFAGFALLPFPHVEESLAELERVGAVEGLRGCAFGITGLGRTLLEPAYEPVLSAIAARDHTVFLHPVGNACGFYPSRFDQTWLVGAVFEDSVFVADLLTSGWLEDHPALRVLIPHLGGAIPFILQRLDDQHLARVPGGSPPSAHAGRLWYDSVNSDPRALRLAVEALGGDRVVLGTDFPYLAGERFATAVSYLREAGLDADGLAAVERENARALLGA
ncbi:MAG: amidohydrolase [Actinomycetales bacterium]|nr:amidohydrolase [Actinomycetales bacterium]